MSGGRLTHEQAESAGNPSSEHAIGMSAETQSEPNVRPATGGVSDAVVVTHEDIDRARDRARVRLARRGSGLRSRMWLLWLLIGPGILVMLGENDGPSMLS